MFILVILKLLFISFFFLHHIHSASPPLILKPNLSPFVSSVFPSCLLTRDQSSVLCDKTPNPIETKGLNVSPPQHSITNSPSRGLAPFHPLPHAASPVQTIISRRRHGRSLFVLSFEVLSVTVPCANLGPEYSRRHMRPKRALFLFRWVGIIKLLCWWCLSSSVACRVGAH